jgi:hypothetical protein
MTLKFRSLCGGRYPEDGRAADADLSRDLRRPYPGSLERRFPISRLGTRCEGSEGDQSTKSIERIQFISVLTF